jgi:tetratricopeptide (TPR) repeat protein
MLIQGLNHQIEGRSAEALEALTQAQHFNPNWGEPSLRLGWLHLQLGEATNAQVVFRRAAQIAPGSPAPLFGRAAAAFMASTHNFVSPVEYLKKADAMLPHIDAAAAAATNFLVTAAESTEEHSADPASGNLPQAMLWCDLVKVGYWRCGMRPPSFLTDAARGPAVLGLSLLECIAEPPFIFIPHGDTKQHRTLVSASVKKMVTGGMAIRRMKVAAQYDKPF